MATIGVLGAGSYVVVPAFAITWTAADAAAVAAGGHQVTLADAAEDDFVLALVRGTGIGDYWIGLTDAAVEGSFAWSNGEPVTYTDWGDGEPNDLRGEDYTTGDRQGTGQWNDLSDAGLPGFFVGGHVIEFDDAGAFRAEANPFRATGDAFLGSAGDDTITAFGGADTLTGGAGDDRMTGGGGADLFVLSAADGPGRDTVTDFDAKGNDTLRLEGFGLDFDTLLAGARQRADKVVLDLGGGATLQLIGATLDQLTAEDVVFA